MSYTRAQVRDLIRQACDLENTTSQVDAEINNHINDSASVVHDFLIATWGGRYSRNTATQAVTAGVADYTISTANDFYKPIRISLTFDNIDYPLASFHIEDVVKSTLGTAWGPGYLPRYELRQETSDTFKIAFDPPPDTARTVNLTYHPRAPVYTTDGDFVTIPHVDLLIQEACVRVKKKEQRDATSYMQEREVIKKRIEDWAGSVDQMQPPKTMWAPRGGRASWRRDSRLF